MKILEYERFYDAELVNEDSCEIIELMLYVHGPIATPVYEDKFYFKHLDLFFQNVKSIGNFTNPEFWQHPNNIIQMMKAFIL